MTVQESVSWVRQSRRMLLVLLAAVLVVLVVGRVVWARLSNDDQVGNAQATFEVNKGPLIISVSTTGTVKARELEIIKNELEGQTTIIWLIEEGKRVEEGELLVELDASRLQDELVDQEIRVQNAEASWISATEQLEVDKNQAKSDVAKAELADRFAKEDLQNYLDGEFPTKLKEADAKVTLSMSENSRAEDRVLWSRILAEKDFISETELEADEQAARKAKLDKELAEASKDLLQRFTYERQLAQLESDVSQAEMALERAQRKASADVIQSEAGLRAKDSEFKRQQDKLTKLNDQITKAKIVAPTAGLVVYATTGRGSWRGNQEPLDEGKSVREREELIHLPTAEDFVASVDVHEASLSKIRPGLPVRITVEAMPGKTYYGHVTTIAPLPDAQSVWLNPDLKVYSTEVVIEGDSEGLRTGMSCNAEIVVETHEAATYVPVHAVVRMNGEPTVFVVEGGKTRARAVEIGLDNNRMVQVISGLEPGERVSLVPPLTPDLASAHEEQVAMNAEEAEEVSKLKPKDPAELVKEEPRGRDEELGEEAASESPEALRERFQNMSDEEREQMRQRFQNMSQEERDRLRQQFGGGRGRRGAGEAGGGGERRNRDEAGGGGERRNRDEAGGRSQ
jgi:HlyD family secretion protein